MSKSNYPALVLLLVGLALIVGGGRGCDHLPWPGPSPFIEPEKYPDAWLIFVEESSERDLDFAVLLQNKKWTDSLKERQISYRVYDKDQPAAEGYLKHCKSYPWLLVVNVDGTLVKSVEAPKNAAKADEIIAEVIGK
jgi:hypothetical protein